MNYYTDTEFIEDFITVLKWPWGKNHTFHYIDLISIGIVAEDGREYYAVNKEFDLKHVWNKRDLKLPESMGDAPIKDYWLRENVLRPIHKDLCKNISGDMKNQDYFYDLSTFSYKSLRSLISIYGKTKAQIAAEIQCFTAGGSYINKPGIVQTNMDTVAELNKNNPPTFYGYYCDYDWVVFCSLFGRMLDLPKGYPMYMHDLKQDMEVMGFTKEWKNKFVPGDSEHHALADARWNKRLHMMMLKHATLYSWAVNPPKSIS